MKLEPDVTPSGLNGKVEMAAVVLDLFTPDSTPSVPIAIGKNPDGS